MNDTVKTVTEYACLTTKNKEQYTLSCQQISVETFNILRRMDESSRRGGTPVFKSRDESSLYLSSYVGVIAGYGGTSIEILPKLASCSGGDVERLRMLLVKMLNEVHGLPLERGGSASVRRLKKPLVAWVVDQFLLCLQKLALQGMCFAYEQKHEVCTFMRGRMDLSRQIILPPHRQHLFEVFHEVFSLNRPEHRLIKLALDKCRCYAPHIDNAALLLSLSDGLRDIPASRNVSDDFMAWSSSRHMRQYEPVRPWCELVLSDTMPYAVSGEHSGISMLFPMEKLFEGYVTAKLQRMRKHEVRVEAQARGHYLCSLAFSEEGGARNFFLLKPDILLRQDGHVLFLIDAKWKIISSGKGRNLGLSQEDFYQLYAYGQKYLDGKGDMALIYPWHGDFPQLDSPLAFSEDLRLWVLGYDLEEDGIVMPPSCPLRQYLKTGNDEWSFCRCFPAKKVVS